jgi:hypothetical protein
MMWNAKYSRANKKLSMKKALLLIGYGLILVIFLVGCFNLESTQDLNQPTPIVFMPKTQPTSLTPTQTETDMTSDGITISSTGPLLLIQIDSSTYQILDILNQTAYPFDPPGRDQHYYLSSNLSPSGRQMIFPVNEREVQVIALDTGQVHKTYFLDSDSPLFDLAQAAQEAQQIIPNLHYAEEDLRIAIQNALIRSKHNIRWYQSDRYLLSVLEGDQTNTYLHLDDQNTGQRHQLEHMPAMVEDYWIGPASDYILLKKGFIFEPGVWQDDRYYLVNVKERSAQSLPLPLDVDHPTVYWVDSDLLGIIHKTQPVGGVGFSVINIKTMELTRILEGDFTHVSLYQENLLVMRMGSVAGTTDIALRSHFGAVVLSKRIESECFFKRILGDQILLNCEKDSRLINVDLYEKSFGVPIFILSSSPDGAHHISITRNEETYILDGSLQDRQLLTLAGPPLEIRWLPDSSGFIYRMRGKLFYFDLVDRANIFLLRSELFDDYTNINAVWINLN